MAPMIVAPTRLRSTPPRTIAGIAKHREREHDGEGQQADGGEPATPPSAPGTPRLDEHLVLQRGADRAAARRDLRERVARELRRDHRVPAAGVDGEALQRPQAGQRRELRDRP